MTGFDPAAEAPRAGEPRTGASRAPGQGQESGRERMLAALTSEATTLAGTDSDPPRPPAPRIPPLERFVDRLRLLPFWVIPAFVTALGGLLRLVGLGHPQEIMFDETYYVKDAWTLWNLGYEAEWPDGSDELLAQGILPDFTTDPSFIVHPPLGRWLIALGMAWLGPESAWGWRITTAIGGTIAVLLVYLIARSLSGSRLIGGLAGLLMAIDGSAITMSRIALLDGWLMLFALAGVAAVVADRKAVAARGTPAFWRPWLLTAGLAFGAAGAVKWTGLVFLALFGLYTAIADLVALRRAQRPPAGDGNNDNDNGNGNGNIAGPRSHPLRGALTRAGTSFLQLVPIAAVVQLASWTGWFLSENGYHRHWAERAGNAATGFWSWVPLDLQSWWHYQQAAFGFHSSLANPHSYEAPAWSWPLMLRPTLMYTDWFDGDCFSERCVEVVTGIANPLIWWGGWAALIWLAVLLVVRGRRLGRYFGIASPVVTDAPLFAEQQRQLRHAAVLLLVAVAAGWGPWLLFAERVGFQFYAVTLTPYAVIAFALMLGAAARRSPTGLRGVVSTLTVAGALTLWWLPLWTAITVPALLYRLHSWLPGWF